MNAITASWLTRLQTARRWSFIVGVVALIAVAVGAVSDPGQFMRTYLAAYIFYFGLAMGSMALLMVYHLTGGAWGFLIRRFLERGVSTLPLVAVGFVPIALGLEHIYPFAQRDLVAGNDLLEFQQMYLSVPLFQARAAAFFLLWFVLAYCLLAWSRAQDRTGDPRYARRCENLSGPGLVIYGVTMHFASIDWLMSLQPAFHSTIFGPLVVSGQVLSAHALALVMLLLACRSTPVADRVSPKALNDLGNLLLALLVIWAYMCWFQYMLIWIANLPVDAVWYMPRLRRGWQVVALALVVVHFVIPFVLLLWRGVKQNIRALVAIAGTILLAQLMFDVYQVAPPFQADGLSQQWMELVTPIGLGGLWLFAFLGRIEHWSTLAKHDANEASAVRLRLSDEREAAWEEAFSHG